MFDIFVKVITDLVSFREGLLCLTSEYLQFADGFLFVDELLTVPELRRYTEADVRRVVTTNDKQRFHIVVDKSTGRLKVCAKQGHSVEVSR